MKTEKPPRQTRGNDNGASEAGNGASEVVAGASASEVVIGASARKDVDEVSASQSQAGTGESILSTPNITEFVQGASKKRKVGSNTRFTPPKQSKKPQKKSNGLYVFICQAKCYSSNNSSHHQKIKHLNRANC
jgi:hypothetical protein